MIPCIKNILPFLSTHFMTHHPNLPHLAVFGARFLPHCTPPPHHTHTAFFCITSHPNASLSTSSYRFWYIIPSNLAVFSSPLQPTKRAPHPNLSIFSNPTQAHTHLISPSLLELHPIYARPILPSLVTCVNTRVSLAY